MQRTFSKIAKAMPTVAIETHYLQFIDQYILKEVKAYHLVHKYG